MSSESRIEMSDWEAFKFFVAMMFAVVIAIAAACVTVMVILLPWIPTYPESWKEATALYFTTTSSKSGDSRWVAVRVEDGSIRTLQARSVDTVGCKVVYRRKSSIFGWNVQYERNPEPDDALGSNP